MKNKTIYITGKKIYLRPLEKRDINLNYLKWINNDHISGHLEANRFPNSIKDLKNYYNNYKNSKNSILFAICLKKNSQHIGNCTLTNIDWINRRAQYGRLIGDKKKNLKGLGSEALDLLKEYAFNKINLNSIWTGVNEKNIASIKSNIKSGMNKVGSFPESVFYKGKLVKMILFSMTKKEFEKNKKS